MGIFDRTLGDHTVNYPSWLAWGTGTLILITGPVGGQTGRTRGPEQILGIHLYDQAQVSAGVLHAATVEAARLFRAAGIRISWEQLLVEAPEDRGLDMSARK